MGSQFSRTTSSRRGSGSGSGSNNSNSNTTAEPPSDATSSYEAACRADPYLQSFDSSVQLRTSRAINSIAVGLEVRALSLDSLRDVTETLLEMNHEVVKIILQNKKDIWKNKELSDLVDDYFENSLLTLDFCTSLDACLKRAGHLESIIKFALRKFEEEHYSVAENGSVKNYAKTLEELNNFKAAGDPFSQEYFSAFNSVYVKQIGMLERLQVKKRKLDKKLARLRVWRKVSNVIFVVTFASVLICSVVAAALSAPPVVTALAAAAAVPLGSMGRWLNSIWKKCEKDLRGQREIISAMQIGSYIVVKDLDSIRVLVERFQIEIEALLGNAEFAMRGEEAVVIAVEEIKKKVDEFVKTIHDLSEHANKCTQETRMARTLILRRIINHPSGSSQDIVSLFLISCLGTHTSVTMSSTSPTMYLSPNSDFYHSPETCWVLKIDVGDSDLLEEGLNDVMEGLPTMQQEMQKTSFQNKKDSWTDKESWKLIHDYLVNSQSPLKFCTEVNGFAERYTDNFSNTTVSHSKYMRAFLGLKEYFGDLSTVRKMQTAVMKRSQAKIMKLDQKLETVEMLRKLSTVLFLVMFASVLIGSVIVTVVKFPPVMTPLIAAATIPLASIWKWFTSKCRKYESNCRVQVHIFSAIRTGSNIASQGLATIAVVIDILHIQNEAIQVF